MRFVYGVVLLLTRALAHAGHFFAPGCISSTIKNDALGGFK